MSNRPGWRDHTRRALHNALAEVADLQIALLADDAKRERQARERAMTAAVARTNVFRDGTPKDKPGHREVARRYAWYAYEAGKSLPRPARGQTGSSKLLTLIRMRELERLINFRHGKFLPDDREGRQLLEIVGHHIVHLGADASRKIVAWARVWAPYMHESEAASIAKSVTANPLKFKADTLSWRLKLSFAERQSLSITTIGAFDLSKDERELRRRELRTARARLLRRENGATPRSQYEARSKAQTRPWEKLGMSRATWYRRGMPTLSKEDLERWEDRREDRELLGGFSRSNTDSETSARPAGDSDYAVQGLVSARAPAGAAARTYAPAAHLVAPCARGVLGRGSNRVSGATHPPPVHIEKTANQPEPAGDGLVTKNSDRK